MKHNYIDIINRIAEAPSWYDENGTPRYGEFSPNLCPNIYAAECVLMRIECQGCGHEFDVSLSCDRYAAVDALGLLSDRIRNSTIHYGDPPNTGCCMAGPTMNSVPKRILQFWGWPSGAPKWTRDPALEVEIKRD